MIIHHQNYNQGIQFIADNEELKTVLQKSLEEQSLDQVILESGKSSKSLGNDHTICGLFCDIDKVPMEELNGKPSIHLPWNK